MDAGAGVDPGSVFGWKEVLDDAPTPHEFVEALRHPRAVDGFAADWCAVKWADCTVLVLPCGRSAHLEAGFAVGAGKPLAVLLDPDMSPEPELMYKMAALITADLDSLADWCDRS